MTGDDMPASAKPITAASGGRFTLTASYPIQDIREALRPAEFNPIVSSAGKTPMCGKNCQKNGKEGRKPLRKHFHAPVKNGISKTIIGLSERSLGLKSRTGGKTKETHTDTHAQCHIVSVLRG